jgi:hypothetical protein
MIAVTQENSYGNQQAIPAGELLDLQHLLQENRTLRWDRNFYKSLLERATAREQLLKQEIQQLNARIRYADDSVPAGLCGQSGPSPGWFNVFFALDDVDRAVGSTTISGYVMKDNSQQYRYCGWDFSGAELEQIRQIIASDERLNRVNISWRVCEVFGWYKPDGGLKEMSCRVALLRMERDGLIRLPPPQKGNGNRTARVRISSASDPESEVCIGAGALGPLRLEMVVKGATSQLWNELIERYHYLGHKPLPGAQLRYFVFSGSRLLAIMGFGASAWSVAGRDCYIGWTAKQRKSNLHLIVNNARFLILPWVHSRNLASKILSLACQSPAFFWAHSFYSIRCELQYWIRLWAMC